MTMRVERRRGARVRGLSLRTVGGVLVSVLVTALAVSPSAAGAGQTDRTPESPRGVQAQSAPATVATDFPDVPPGNTFATEIAWLVAQGITNGYPDGGFHPSASITRQAFAAFLFRLDGQVGGGACSDVGPFPDVPASSPFCQETSWMVGLGVPTGYADGGFHPGASISRQAMAAFMYRYDHGGADLGACEYVGPFPDVDAAGPFCEAIRWMAAIGPEPITTGYADGTFRLTAPVTRQAMAAYLYRYRIDVPAARNEVTYDAVSTAIEPPPGEVLGTTQDVTPGAVDEEGAQTSPDSIVVVVTLASTSEVPDVGDPFVVAPGDPQVPDGLAGVVVAVEGAEDGG